MIEKTFSCPTGKRVLIKIDDEIISFYDKETVDAQAEWYENQLIEGNDVEPSEKNVDEFYWIPKKEWANDAIQKRNNRLYDWHLHMQDKNWFTEEMSAFIDKNTNQ